MRRLSEIAKRSAILGAAGLLAASMAAPAFAQESSVGTEIDTAQAHAKMAQGSDTADMAHTHLHHVINCLVGTDGDGFDADAGNPCKGQGDGAIPDSKGNSAVTSKLKSALSDAQSGLKSDDLSIIQKDAGKAATTLGEAAPQNTDDDNQS